MPFSSKRKRATTALLLPDDKNKVRVFCKGAPEIVLGFCTKFLDKSGSQAEMTQKMKDELMNVVVKEQFAKECLRTLLMAYVDYDLKKFNELKK